MAGHGRVIQHDIGVVGVLAVVMRDAADRGHEDHARRHQRREILGIMSRPGWQFPACKAVRQGGGVLSDMGCHSIAAAWHILTPLGKPLRFLEPVSVQAETALLKWALRNPSIATAIPGATTYEQLEQNFNVASNLEYTAAEKEFLGDRSFAAQSLSWYS